MLKKGLNPYPIVATIDLCCRGSKTVSICICAQPGLALHFVPSNLTVHCLQFDLALRSSPRSGGSLMSVSDS